MSDFGKKLSKVTDDLFGNAAGEVDQWFMSDGLNRLEKALMNEAAEGKSSFVMFTNEAGAGSVFYNLPTGAEGVIFPYVRPLVAKIREWCKSNDVALEVLTSDQRSAIFILAWEIPSIKKSSYDALNEAASRFKNLPQYRG